MANQERISNSRERIAVPDRELEALRDKQHELTRHKLEDLEQSRQENLNDVTKEALEKAQSKHERHVAKQEKQTAPEHVEHEKPKQGRVTKNQKEVAFKKTMKVVQDDLPLTSRTFSKIVHNPLIEKVSDTVGSTIARPNVILTGSFCAFVFTLSIFLIARHYGYPLSGTETIAGFTVGWAVGILFDYLRLMITGKTT